MEIAGAVAKGKNAGFEALGGWNAEGSG